MQLHTLIRDTLITYRGSNDTLKADSSRLQETLASIARIFEMLRNFTEQ